MKEAPRLIALAGLSRTGKDTLGAEFVKAGYWRVAMGDHLKELFAPIINQIYGLNSFTEIDAEKDQFRPILVHGGEVPGIYEYVLGNMMDEAIGAPIGAINTRLFRPIEAEAWIAAGGEVWLVERPGTQPKEPKEALYVQQMLDRGMISRTVVNDAPDAEGWQWKSRAIVSGLLEKELA